MSHPDTKVNKKMVGEAKTQVWEELGKVIEKDFELTSRIFWHTIQ